MLASLILVAHLTIPSAVVLGWDLSELIPVSPAYAAAVVTNDGDKTDGKDEVN